MRLSKKIVLAFVALAMVAGGVSRYLFVAPDSGPPPLSGQLLRQDIDIDGLARSFDYYVPEPYRPDAGIVIALHPSQGNGERMRRATAYAFDELADEHGFIVAYPDGYRRHWNDCRSAATYAAKERDIDDLSFLTAMLAFFRDELGSDTGKTLAVGLSNGGQMSYRIALEAPELIRAAVAIAASMPAENNLDCEPSGKPVAMMIVNGTDDPINPYSGGEVTLIGPFGSRGFVESSRDSATYWAALAGHAGEPFQHRFPDVVPEDGSVAMRMTWSGGGPAVSLITVYGGGHTIPHPTGNFPRIFGPVNRDFSAAEAAWRFFQQEMDRSDAAYLR